MAHAMGYILSPFGLGAAVKEVQSQASFSAVGYDLSPFGFASSFSIATPV